MAGTNTPSTGRTTAASKRAAAAAAAATNSSNGRPRRAAGDASPYASTSTGTGKASASPSKGKGKATSTGKGKGKASPATAVPPREDDDDSAPNDETQAGFKDGVKLKAPPAEQTRCVSVPSFLTATRPGAAPLCPLFLTVGVPGAAYRLTPSLLPRDCSISSERNPFAPANIEATTEPVLTSDMKEAVSSTTITTAPKASVKPETDGPDPRSKATVPAPLSGLAPPAPTDSSASSSSSSSFAASAPPTNATNGDGGRRKSVRSTRSKGLDYSNLNQHLPASVDRWTSTIDARTKSGQIVSGFAPSPSGSGAAEDGLGWRRFANGYELEKMGDEWIYGSSASGSASAGAESGGGGASEGGEGGGGEGMMEPFVVESPEGLGMEMPKAGISVRVVADLVGEFLPHLPSSTYK